MSLNQFLSKVNNKRVNNKLRVISRYSDKYINSEIVIFIYDEGLQFYDNTRHLLVLDLNVIKCL